MPQIHQDKTFISRVSKNLWEILKPIEIATPFGVVLVYPGYQFDKDSVVRNSPDWIPSLIHDFMYEHRVFSDLEACDRMQADIAYYVLNRNSVEEYNRSVALRNFDGVRVGGWFPWYTKPKITGVARPRPIPAIARHLYVAET